MTTQIVIKANEIIKNANFTKLIKARKNAGACFLIMNTSQYAIYGSYSSETYYVKDNLNWFKLA
jgi:hypothetical protein